MMKNTTGPAAPAAPFKKADMALNVALNAEKDGDAEKTERWLDKGVKYENEAVAAGHKR